MRAWIIAGALLLAALVPAASAHPFIEGTSPAQFSRAPAGITDVIVTYSEGVEIGFSELRVLDASGARVDNGDTQYHGGGDTALRVTVPPLDDGVYTVSSKVLSRVDGHLVSGAFVFAAGDAVIDEADLGDAGAEIVFVPEAAAKLPGMLGQTIVIGAAAAALLVWAGHRGAMRGAERDGADAQHRGRFMTLVGAGTVMVFASDLLMLTVQSLRLGVPAVEALGTDFGGTLLVRIGITAALIAAWFAAERRRGMRPAWHAAFLALGLALAATTTAVGHGAASGEPAAVALDYAHNIVAGIWIGGVIYFAFAMLPSLSALGAERAGALARAAVPAFSSVFIACVGAVIVTGPVLMWMLEDDVSIIAGSTYGALLASKVGLGAAMVGLGAYNQVRVQRGSAAAAVARLRRSLRAEAALGVALLAAVALLTNSTLPAGEVMPADAQASRGPFAVTEFSAGARFGITVDPFEAGANAVTVAVAGAGGEPLGDIKEVKVKVSSPQRGVSPIVTQLDGQGGAYSGEITLGFWGSWEIEVEAVRSDAANEAVVLREIVRPPLRSLDVSITEYELPEGASPLHLVHDSQGGVWVTDPSAPRIWRFDRAAESFAEHAFEGGASVTADVAADGTVWFTDIRGASVWSLDPSTGMTVRVPIPESLEPRGMPAVPVWVMADSSGGVWVTVPNKSAIVRYEPGSGEFETYSVPAPGAAPFSLAEDMQGRIWFSEQSGGTLGLIDHAAGSITEFAADPPLRTAETITPDASGRLWVSEHYEGGSVAVFDPVIGSFERVDAPGEGALPNSVSFDSFGNAWFAQHTVGELAVFDPRTREVASITIPTPESWVQFTAADESGGIWFAEQKPGRLGVASVSAGAPGFAPTAGAGAPVRIDASYAEIAAPLMAAGIIGAALLLVRSSSERREMLAGAAG